MIYRLGWYFFIFSFAGWCAEVLVNFITRRKFADRGFLNGPLCPIYGVSVCAIWLALSPISNRSAILLFIGSMIICSAIELVTGAAMNRIFGFRWWDYSGYRFNFRGYICLTYSVIWGIGGVIIMQMALPLLDVLLTYIPHGIGVISLIIMAALMCIDAIMTTAGLIGISRQVRRISRGERSADETAAQSNIFRRRIVNAFPDMTSDKYEKPVRELKEAIRAAKRESELKKSKKRQQVIDFYEQKIPNETERPFAFGMCPAKLFWLFLIGNVLGCVVETIWCILKNGRFEMRTGVVFGFFIPVYGIGAVLMAVCLCRLYKKHDIWIFVGSAVIGAAVEYVCSLFQEIAFDTVSWDYSNTPMNIGGRTNLMYSMMWGALGVVWVKDIYPRTARLIEKIPKKAGAALTVALAVFLVWDMALSAAAVYRWTERQDGKQPSNRVEVYLDRTFPDKYMEIIYPNMMPVEKIES